MNRAVDTTKAELEIVEVLHKNKIPLALIPTVYENVDQLIKTHTIPCSLLERHGEDKEDLRKVIPKGLWPSSSGGDTLSFAGTGAHRHSFKTNWKPNPEDYMVKDSNSSSTVNEPENSNS